MARRFICEHRYLETKLATADDLQDADGVALQSFRQAAARVDQGIAPDTGPHTIADTLRDYFEAREHEGSKGVKGDPRRCLPALARKPGVLRRFLKSI
jgi:hypothetical protein